MIDPVAELLLDYLNNIVYDPENAVLDLEKLPEGFQDFGKKLVYFAECVSENSKLAKALSKGDLDVKLPPPGNEMASPLKALHASLKHLTWQTQQIAKGDYNQRVYFMGDFSSAFNSMIEKLEHRRLAMAREISREKESLVNLQNIANYDMLTNVYNRYYGMHVLSKWLEDKRSFILCFADIDNLKYVNDRFGHLEGDMYIIRVSNILREFSSDAVICRIGGDEFMLLEQNCSMEDARDRLELMRKRLIGYNDNENAFYENSISYGIIPVGADNTLPAGDLLCAADERMYEYKRMYKIRHKNKK